MRAWIGNGSFMAVDAEIKRSYFTQQLAKKLEEDGISIPTFVLDLLDKPFATFNEEDKNLYETQIKQQELLLLFAKLLQNVYDAAGESAKHSWKGLCHLLKDSPIKVCVSYVIKQEEGPDRQASSAASSAGTRPGPSAGVADGAPVQSSFGASHKSFFTKKLEQKLQERDIKVPQNIIFLLDKPFDDFTEEELKIYESEFKGRQLIILFSDLLDELYEETGRCDSGWTAMCRFLKETPMKLIATYVLQEEERLEGIGKESLLQQESGPQPVKEKFNVKRYQPPPTEQKEPPSRRRRKS
jgi:hypothetical protein